jgi:hypothetical protein
VVALQSNVAEGRDMQSEDCAAEPRSMFVAKRKARATSIRLKGDHAPPKLRLAN